MLALGSFPLARSPIAAVSVQAFVPCIPPRSLRTVGVGGVRDPVTWGQGRGSPWRSTPQSWRVAHWYTTFMSHVNAFLQLEDVPLEVLPRERLPSIHRCYCRRGHSVSTATHPSTFHVTGALSAYPVAFPRAFASEPIPLRPRVRWTPARHEECRERGKSYSVPGPCLPLRTGPHCSPGDVMGCSLEHAVSCPAGEAGRLSGLHVRFGPSP